MITTVTSVGGLVLSLMLSPSSPAIADQKPNLRDTFATYPARTYTDLDTFGPWKVQFAGYGKIATRNRALILRPKAARQPHLTHAALVTSKRTFAKEKLRLTTTMTTKKQLRINSPANPWETGWLVWDYQDSEHFYYAIAKTNGIELGKRDPAYPGGQRFLATWDAPKPAIDDSVKMSATRIVKANKTILKLRVNGERLSKFVDTERPYRVGKVGLYTEDAKVKVDRFVARHTKR